MFKTSPTPTAHLHALSDNELNDYYGDECRYLGTYARDKIPMNLTKRNGAFIVNLNKSTQGGSHWVALLLFGDSSVYFDSFGVVPCEEVLAFMKKRGKPMFFTDIQLQHLESSSCGWFCVYAIDECIIKGRKILDVVLKDFSHSPKRNEHTLSKYFTV